MGTASPELAVEAAKIVASDVSQIDVNSGCPKHFSIHSGMGAALLRTPDKLEAILRALVTQVGEPFKIPISVKIRILDTEEDTIKLVSRLVKTGIRLLTVHCRTTPMRPREPVIRDFLAKIAETCRDAGVACYVNGDVGGRFDLKKLMDEYGVDGAMIARAAESNASCFGAQTEHELVDWHKVASEFVEYALEYDNHLANTKYCLGRIVPGKASCYSAVQQSKSYDDLLNALASADNSANGVQAISDKRPRESSLESQSKRPAIAA
jgi:tRNA-dihydrouridine synthase 2